MQSGTRSRGQEMQRGDETKGSGIDSARRGSGTLPRDPGGDLPARGGRLQDPPLGAATTICANPTADGHPGVPSARGGNPVSSNATTTALKPGGLPRPPMGGANMRRDPILAGESIPDPFVLPKT